MALSRTGRAGRRRPISNAGHSPHPPQGDRPLGLSTRMPWFATTVVQLPLANAIGHDTLRTSTPRSIVNCADVDGSLTLQLQTSPLGARLLGGASPLGTS